MSAFLCSPEQSDRIKAIEVLGKYGGVDKIALTVEEQPESGPLTKKQVAEWWEQVERIKTIKQFEKMLVDTAKQQSATQGD